MNSIGRGRNHLSGSLIEVVVVVLASFFIISLSAGPALATDCPPGDYADCVAVVSSPWNPLVPVVGAIFGAGVAGLIGGTTAVRSRPQRPAPISAQTSIPAPVVPQAPPSMQMTPAGMPSVTSAGTPPPDALPEEPIRNVTITQGPGAPPPAPPPTMQAPSVYGTSTDGTEVRIPSNIVEPIGGPENDRTPGDGRYEDQYGDPVGAPIGLVKRSEVVVGVGLPPGLQTGYNPILDQVLYGADTGPGTGLPGTPSTQETGDPTVKYKRIVYDDPTTNKRYTYAFWRNEGGLQNPLIDEGTYRLVGPPKVTEIPK